LLASPVFNPAVAHAFTIATIDLTVPTIIVPLIAHLRRVAPAIDLRVVPLVREQVVAAFDRHLAAAQPARRTPSRSPLPAA